MARRLKRMFFTGVCLLAVASLTVCSSSENTPNGAAPYSPLWVSIDTNGLATSVNNDFIDLRGSAYCDACPPGDVAFGYCPAAQSALPSGVNVVWTNLTTGQSGTTMHGISGHCSCLFSYCFISYSHTWLTSVRLTAGKNIIEVKAMDASGASATDSVTITMLPVTAINRPDGIAVDAVNDEIFVASVYNSAIFVFARTDSGNATPKRIISGLSTGLASPTGLALDGLHDELFVVNGDHTVEVVARTADGNAAPLRTFSLETRGRSYPNGIAVDGKNNEVFVTNYDSFDKTNDFVAVYDRTANGATSSLRAISGLATGLAAPLDIAVDAVNDELFVANIGAITVYGRTASGNATPLRTIDHAGKSYFQCLAADATNGEVLAAENRWTVDLLGNTVVETLVSAYTRTASGDATPLRTISGPSAGLYLPQHMVVDTVNNEIFVTNYSSDNRITVHARTASGDAAPLRTITSTP